MKSDYLDPSEYVPFAPKVPGEQVHVHHCRKELGKDKLYIKVSEDGSKILAYCHHCRKRGSYLLSGKPIDEYPAKSEGTGLLRKHSVFGLPNDSESDPAKWGATQAGERALSWVEKYLCVGDILDSPLCFSAKQESLLFPLFSEGNLVGYQARPFSDSTVYNTTSKYITYIYKELYTSTSNIVLDIFTNKNSKDICTTLVLVEDYISALKVVNGTDTCDSLPLLGCNLTKGTLQSILTGGYEKVQVALDNDNNEVRRSQAKIVRELSAYLPVRSVLLDKDPKKYLYAELEELFDND